MMECKNALTQAEGDFAKAEKILKELGLAAAEKRSGRATNEGRVFSKITASKGVLLELSCETDFVARNSDFLSLGNSLLGMIIDKNLSSTDASLENKVKDTIGVIKENITLRRFKTITAGSNEFLTDYIHGEGKIGVIVKVKVGKPELAQDESVKAFAFDCALHIAAYNPLFLSKDKVDEAYVKEQEGIFTKQAENLGKPANVLAGIIKGKLNKHLAEICLLDQAFVKDDKRTVAKVAADLSKEKGGEISITDYLYFKVGEEIAS